MKKMALPLTVLVTLLLTSSLAFAVPGIRGGGNGNKGQRGQAMSYEQHQDRVDKRLDRMGIMLDLSTQQKEQLRTLFDNRWEKQQSHRTKMQKSREALRAAEKGAAFNENEFRTLAQKHAALKTDMRVDRVKMAQQIRALLTPEQQKKAEQLRELGGGHHRKHRGMGRGMNGEFGPGPNAF